MTPATATPFAAVTPTPALAVPLQSVGPAFGVELATLLAAPPKASGVGPALDAPVPPPVIAPQLMPPEPAVHKIVPPELVPTAPHLPFATASQPTGLVPFAAEPTLVAAPPMGTTPRSVPLAPPGPLLDTVPVVPTAGPLQVPDSAVAQSLPALTTLAIVADATTKEAPEPEAASSEVEAEPGVVGAAPIPLVLVAEPPRVAMPTPTAGPTSAGRVEVGDAVAVATRAQADKPDLLAQTRAVPEAAAPPDSTPALRVDAHTPDPAATPDFAPALANDPAPAAPTAREDVPAAPTPTTEPTVAARPGQAGRELGLAIARIGRDGGDELVVRLDPVELGRVEVRLAWDEGVLSATVRAEHPAALDLFRREVADLGRALGEAGVRADTGAFRFESGGRDGRQARPDWPDTGRVPTEREMPQSAQAVPEVKLTRGRINLIA